jgi:hypothetical protein
LQPIAAVAFFIRGERKTSCGFYMPGRNGTKCSPKKSKKGNVTWFVKNKRDDNSNDDEDDPSKLPDSCKNMARKVLDFN